jgi:hypothetical protein
MGLTDAVSSAADAAAGALGAGGGSAPKPDPGTPKFVRKDPLDPPKDKKPITAGPNGGDTPPNSAQPPDPTEFVHYGKVHADTTDHFPHPKFDNEKDKKPAGRAILFRDAAQREALLLHGFVSATKSVHEELQKNRGAAGALAGAVGSLLGSSGKEPDPGSLKHLQDDITKAGGTLNDETADYVKIHKAAIDFHQTRADYTKFCEEKLDGYYLKKKDDPAGALLTSLPSVAGPAKTIFGILFKAFDIYFGIYLSLRKEYEPVIEDACYRFSLDTVKKYATHTFSPWYPPKKDKDGKDKDKDKDKKKDSGPLGDVTGAVDDVKDKADDIKKDITDVIGEGDDDKPPSGEDAIKEIFAVFGSGPADDKKKDGDGKDGAATDDKKSDGGDGADAKKDDTPSPADAAKDKPKPKPADGLVCDGFNAVLGTDIGFMKTPIGKMTWANVEFLKAVYLKLAKDSSKKIDQDWLLETAHALIFDKIYGFIEDNVSFIKKVEDFNTDVQGQKLGPKKLIDKGKDALAQKVGAYADPVLKLMVGKLADQIEQIRSDADKDKSLTMEVFLGRLPFLLAFQVRNTTFPLWDLLINEMLGKGNSALDTALKPVKGFIGDARNVAGDVKDKTDRAKQAADKFQKEGVGAGSDGQNLSGYKDILFGDKKKDDQKDGGGGFPGGERKTAGKADKIKNDDLKKAEKDRKDDWPK